MAITIFNISRLKKLVKPEETYKIMINMEHLEVVNHAL